jgi:hypothetical protein
MVHLLALPRSTLERDIGGRDKAVTQAPHALVLGALAAHSREQEWSVKTTLTNIFSCTSPVKECLTGSFSVSMSPLSVGREGP